MVVKIRVAVGNGLQEKNVVLDLANRIENKLKEYKDVQVMQTRTTDVFLELTERTNKANQWGADCFISLHTNALYDCYLQKVSRHMYITATVGDDTRLRFRNICIRKLSRQIGRQGNGRGRNNANFYVFVKAHMKAIPRGKSIYSQTKRCGIIKTNRPSWIE